MSDKLKQLHKLGQSVWYDNLSRDMLETGELKKMIDEWGILGMTSNPTIFDKAISSSALYDATIKTAKSQGLNSAQAFERLAVEDVGRAADFFLPVFERTHGTDGFVSIEVSPLLATDTAGTITEGKRLFKELGRPNIMIKVPGTSEGIPAIKALLLDGINVNVTLLFSVENYVAVAKTYIAALTERAAKGLPIDSIRSVASFFVSRVDTIVDAALDTAALKFPQAAELKGKFGVYNSRAAYAEYQKLFTAKEFSALSAKGAAVQRPLWASTGTKNPAYPDTLYVDQLIGQDTVNTMPLATLKAFIDHGKVAATIEQELSEVSDFPALLKEVGVEVAPLLTKLQVEGVKLFSDSFHSLNTTINNKMASL
ncbi:transaldolase [bacterium]|nr:transaldolase [bacterium]